MKIKTMKMRKMLLFTKMILLAFKTTKLDGRDSTRMKKRRLNKILANINKRKKMEKMNKKSWCLHLETGTI